MVKRNDNELVLLDNRIYDKVLVNKIVYFWYNRLIIGIEWGV